MDRLTLDVEEHLAQATAAGIDTLVFGPATLSEVLNLPPAEAADLLDRIHQEYAAARRAHPAPPWVTVRRASDCSAWFTGTRVATVGIAGHPRRI